MSTLPERRPEGVSGQTPTPDVPLALQIAAQELSDNRVITLSLVGRKLDKKVRQAGEGALHQGAAALPQPWGCVAWDFWPPPSLPLQGQVHSTRPYCHPKLELLHH